MRLKIRHGTVYRYASPAKSVIQTLRLTPNTTGGYDVASAPFHLLPAVGEHLRSKDFIGGRHTLTLPARPADSRSP